MRPIVSPGRVVGLDVARALALIGMMATHILPGIDGGEVTFSQQLAGGRASALFAVLAGASLALMSGGTTPQGGRARLATSVGLVVRALLIAGIGLLLGEVDSGIAVILTYYGVLFLLTVPFLGLGPRVLGVLAGVWLVAGPVLSQLVRPQLPSPSYASPSVAGLEDPWQLLTELTFTGYYPAVPWLAYALAGMALGRLVLSDVRTAGMVAAVGAALASVSVLLSAALLRTPGARRELLETFTAPGDVASLELAMQRGFYGTTPTETWWWLAVDAPHTATPFDLGHTIGTALLVIGLCILAARSAPSVFAVVFGAGAMTLTLYSAHVVSRNEGWWDGDTLEVFVSQVVVALLLGAGYRLARRRGPLETAVGVAQKEFMSAAAPRQPTRARSGGSSP